MFKFEDLSSATPLNRTETKSSPQAHSLQQTSPSVNITRKPILHIPSIEEYKQAAVCGMYIKYLVLFHILI